MPRITSLLGLYLHTCKHHGSVLKYLAERFEGFHNLEPRCSHFLVALPEVDYLVGPKVTYVFLCAIEKILISLTLVQFFAKCKMVYQMSGNHSICIHQPLRCLKFQDLGAFLCYSSHMSHESAATFFQIYLIHL